MISERHHVAAKVIATVDDLERIAADDDADVPALTGWRRELFGEKALALKHGKLALAIEKGQRRRGRARIASAHPISITGSRPMRRASARCRLKTRSPDSAANSPGSRSASRCRSTASGVRGSTPGMAADTT